MNVANWLLMLMSAGLLCSCKGGDMKPNKVLPCEIAGRWFTADTNALRRELAGYFDAAKPEPLANVCALIQPHAGYQFSGAIAAHGAKLVQGKKFSRVIVLGPSHQFGMRNGLAVPDGTHLATPLGTLPLDVEALAKLRALPFVNTQGFGRGEHSVEIQLPVLQMALGEFLLLPIVVGQFDEAATRQVAAVLKSLVDAQTLVVVSSDFTHYGANYGYLPFRTNVAENLKKLDLGAFETIAAKDLPAFRAYLDKTGATICGHDPIGLLLAMLPPKAQAHLVKYDTSGNLTGDRNMSVSYLCAAFTGTWERGPMPKVQTAGPLSADDKKALLKLARGMIETQLKTGKRAQPEDLGITVTPAMKAIMGAFVTLHKDGDLRGCIGEIEPRRPLVEAVREQALNSAFSDPRFTPVVAAELPRIKVEISALTQPAPVNSWKDIVIGKHGMVLIKHGRSAVFLPQVAPEQGWDLPTTLTHLSMKAGLPSDAWKEGASYLVFEAIVFHDEK
jgi:AmmeMemoRadiSam system protein B/AmmeMemoRadiSam system protein A